ncbi:MAG TPA: hypothetical protein VGQ12_07610 [Candidatus Angelobacter sp.]|jgi:hypothetical protein|nr:hypothetical protein [Candidatus Angelobacter sp.]
MALLSDIISRVQFMLDDPEGTGDGDPDYITGFAQNQYDRLYNKLRANGHNFDQVTIELPAVAAGIPDLGVYQAPGAVLALMVQPRMVEWKLPGQDASNYLEASGPLDKLPDIVAGIPQLSAWAWIRRKLQVSRFSTALDLRVTGDFLFDPLTDGNSPIEIEITANPVLSYLMVRAVAKARGRRQLVVDYEEEEKETFDDLNIALTKANLSKNRRVGRMSRRETGSGFTLPRP